MRRHPHSGASALTCERLLIAAAISLFLLFSLLDLELPGLQYDELLFANAALGNIDGSFIHWEAQVGTLRIPVMLMDYVGALKAWIYAPVFALFGGSAATARVPVVVIGLLTVACTYGIARMMLGRGTAALATILFATDPTFIFANKLDWGPVSLMLFLKMAALCCLALWLRRGGLFWCGAGGFLLGLGLFDKIIFIWAIGAMAFAFVACYGAQLRARVHWKSAAVLSILFLAGCLPLIAFNVKYPLRTFSDQKLAARGKPWDEYIRYRSFIFQQTLDGRAVHSFVAGMPLSEVLAQPANDRLGKGVASVFRWMPLDRTLLPCALVASLALLAVLRWRGTLARPRETLFFVALLLVMAVLILATAQATGPHHVVALYPAAHVVAAAACAALWHSVERAGSRVRGLAVRGLATGAWVSLLVSQLLVDCGYLKSFRLHGGSRYWSDAIYQLADYGKQRPETRLILMDWGFATQLLLLSNGTQKKEEAFFHILGGADAAARVDRVLPWILSPGAVFVFHTPQFESQPTMELFSRALSEYQLSARQLKLFCQRDGQPIYALLEIVRPEVESHVREGRFFCFREAEDWDAVRGGGPESRPTASLLGTLGNGWGGRHSDLASYKIRVSGDVPDTQLVARFVAAGGSAMRLRVSVDGLLRGYLDVPRGEAAGSREEAWQTRAVPIGSLEGGVHEFTFMPESDGRAVNLDCFYLAQGEFRLRELTRRTKGHEASEPVILQGQKGRATVEANAPVLRAGKDTLVLRITNLPVPAIDVQYTLDGVAMPILLNWSFDHEGRIAVFVDRDTRKGRYRFLAIRDSRSGSSWIPVNVTVDVR